MKAALLSIFASACLSSFLFGAGLGEAVIEAPDGFVVERVYTVPPQSQGSWVALAADEEGNLVAGDQRGGLYRVMLDEETRTVESVRALDVPIGHVNGLVFAHGSLYAMVADDVHEGGGLYRLRDEDGDGVYEQTQKLLGLAGKGEHGQHNVVPGPDGNSIYIIAGNKTPIPLDETWTSRVPLHWGEDDLLPRLWGPIGSEKGTTAPGGWIARADSDGARWELLAIGLRNGFDIAFDRRGELFTADADAEFDLGTPWYQPTRLLHVVDGTDYGWRSGSGKWPAYYQDTLPPVYEFGPGSPTGVTFGYGADFPQRYQDAIYTCDWSWGRIFVTWLEPEGATYVGRTEEFLTGVPLPVVDLIVNPKDGHMYFVLGGRGTSSGLYRIRFDGPEMSAGQTNDEVILPPAVEERRQLAELLQGQSEEAWRSAWPYLSSPDRALRHAARLVLEQAPTEAWAERAIDEADPVGRLTALLALGRAGDSHWLTQLVDAILELDWSKFDRERRLLAVRALEVGLLRMADDDRTFREGELWTRLRNRLEGDFPNSDDELDTEIAKLLIFLDSTEVTAEAVSLVANAVTPAEKLRWMAPLRTQRNGWTPELRTRFFQELGEAHGWKGGLSLTKYVEAIAADSLHDMPDKEKAKWVAVMEKAKPDVEGALVVDREFERNWTLEELLPISAAEIASGDPQAGRSAFAAASCFACHRVGDAGAGIGPDLTAATRRFSPRDLLEAIVEPSRVISDQYGMTLIETTDGETLYGKVVNYYGEAIGFQTDFIDAGDVRRVPRSEIVSMNPSPISPMPPGLLNTLTRKDIVDLLAYLSEAAGVIGNP